MVEACGLGNSDAESSGDVGLVNWSVLFVPPDLRDSTSVVFSEDDEDISPDLGAIGSFGRNFWEVEAGGEDLRICAAVLPPFEAMAFIAPFIVGVRVEPFREGKSSSLGTRCCCGCNFEPDEALRGADVTPKPVSPPRVASFRLLERFSALIFEGKDARVWAMEALSGWTPP